MHTPHVRPYRQADRPHVASGEDSYRTVQADSQLVGLQAVDLHAWRSSSGVSRADITGDAKAEGEPVPPTDVSHLYSLWRRLAPMSDRVLE